MIKWHCCQPGHYLEHVVCDIAVSEDDKLHVATEGGVHVYTTDGTCTGQSYLAGEKCMSITCTVTNTVLLE